MRILAIGAHADDVELGCGGTLAKAIQNGHMVNVVVMSDSSYSNYDGTVLRTKEDASHEAISAIKELGIEETNFTVLDFETKDVPYNSDSVESLDKLMNSYSPDLILTHWTFDTHQDHRNTALATISAARNSNNILMYEPFPPSGRSYVAYRPQVYVDITDSIPTKIRSIEAHESQLNKYGSEWIDSITGRAKMRGFESGVTYAETFEMLRYKLEL